MVLVAAGLPLRLVRLVAVPVRLVPVRLFAAPLRLRLVVPAARSVRAALPRALRPPASERWLAALRERAERASLAAAISWSIRCPASLVQR